MFMTSPGSDLERGSGANADVVFRNLDFTEKSIRQGFIRKVYGILAVQLSITLGVVSLFMFVEPVKNFVQHQAHVFIVISALVICVVVLMIFCSEKARRTAPGNYIFLVLFTLAMSFFVGVICAAASTEEVLMALGLCTVVCVSLTLLAFQTKIDFTLFHSGLFTLLTLLCVVSMATYIFYLTRPDSFELRMMQLGLSGLGAFLFSLYLIYDTQLIIGGKHGYAISPEEYVFAALILYMDVIILFLRILRIIRLLNRD